MVGAIKGLGIPLSEEKTEWDVGGRITILGHGVLLERPLKRYVDPYKRRRVQDMLQEWQGEDVPAVPFVDLERFLGLMVFIESDMQTEFSLQYLFAALHSVWRGKVEWSPLGKEAKRQLSGIEWALEKEVIVEERQERWDEPSVELASGVPVTDAELGGVGGLLMVEDKGWYFKQRMDEKYGELAIYLIEGYTVIMAVELFKEKLKGCVNMRCDNQTVCFGFNKGRGETEAFRRLVERFKVAQNRTGITPRLHYIKTKENKAADCLSRDKERGFRDSVEAYRKREGYERIEMQRIEVREEGYMKGILDELLELERSKEERKKGRRSAAWYKTRGQRKCRGGRRKEATEE